MGAPESSPRMLSTSLRVLHLAALLAVVGANPLGRRAMAVHERRIAVPSGFVHSGSVPAGEEITLRIALTSTDMAGLEKTVYEISDPANAKYGQHLTPAERSLSGFPTMASPAFVASASNAGDVLKITIPISKADELLSTEFRSFKHVVSRTEGIHTLAYSVPASLKPFIKFVHPTIAFVAPLYHGKPGVTAINTKRALGKQKRELVVEERATAPASCAGVVTPMCLQAFYNIPTAKATSSATNVLVSLDTLALNIIIEGSFWLIGGTSAACPIFASIISLSSPPVICYYFGPTLQQISNSASFAAGKPVLGFLNPFLYSAAGRAAFMDVVFGTNPGCHAEGFSSKVGWDPVTGLGTPDYNLLLKAVGL
ncbi:hypothetical protein C8J57DRAFT_1228743 [Mycena rebaudengoi]|nr:hypothetical protein C8J57DRAFT_1228743 [Mycena rebaudengoi]